MTMRSSQRPRHQHATDSENDLLNFTNFLILDGLTKSTSPLGKLWALERRSMFTDICIL